MGKFTQVKLKGVNLPEFCAEQQAVAMIYSGRHYVFFRKQLLRVKSEDG